MKSVGFVSHYDCPLRFTNSNYLLRFTSIQPMVVWAQGLEVVKITFEGEFKPMLFAGPGVIQLDEALYKASQIKMVS